MSGITFPENAKGITFKGKDQPNESQKFDTWFDSDKKIMKVNKHAWKRIGGHTPLVAYVWGDNNYGQLGLGDTNSRSIPTQLGDYNEWEKIIVTGNNTYLLPLDSNYLFGCGQNNYGQLFY